MNNMKNGNACCQAAGFNLEMLKAGGDPCLNSKSKFPEAMNVDVVAINL